MNVQYALKDDVVYVLEVNPRASRTVPFVSKATGVPLAQVAARVMAGQSLAEAGLTAEPPVNGFFVKEAVLPWKKFTGIDTLLGPEMRSTGEVMGAAPNFGHAFAKSQLGAGVGLPTANSEQLSVSSNQPEGMSTNGVDSDGPGVLITVNDFDKGAALKIARDLHRLGFHIFATEGTATLIERNAIPVTVLDKAAETEEGRSGHTTLERHAQRPDRPDHQHPARLPGPRRRSQNPPPRHAHGNPADHDALGGAGPR